MAEANRFVELDRLQKGGVITNLRCQKRYPIRAPTGVLLTTYVSDFVYVDTETGVEVIEDVKSPATITPLFKLKQKLMQEMLGLTVTVHMVVYRAKKKRTKR